MPITLNPSKLFETPENVRATLGAAFRVAPNPSQSRNEFDESLARAKSENARAAEKPARVDPAKPEKRVAKPAKSTKRRTADGPDEKPPADVANDDTAASVSAGHPRQDAAEAASVDE